MNLEKINHKSDSSQYSLDNKLMENRSTDNSEKCVSQEDEQPLSDTAQQILTALFDAKYDFLRASEYDYMPCLRNVSTFEMMLIFRIDFKYLRQVLDALLRSDLSGLQVFFTKFK